MRFCVSNIAWNHDERMEAYSLLHSAGFTELEIAPGIFFEGEADVFMPSDRRVELALAEVEAAGLHLTSMQALLFGVEGAALFGTPRERERFDAAMQRAIRLAGRLGIPNLVFGSPRQRAIPIGMTLSEAADIAVQCFQSLGDLAETLGTRILIEPNPAGYGTNFLNRQADVEAFLDGVSHPAICGIIDTGAMAMNGEGFDDIAVNLARISHVHCSAPQLAPSPASAGEAQTVLAGLLGLGYTATVSIEMKRTANGIDDVRTSVFYLASAANALGLMGQE
jgi:sugar phosphate isomerase/epimerase